MHRFCFRAPWHVRFHHPRCIYSSVSSPSTTCSQSKNLHDNNVENSQLVSLSPPSLSRASVIALPATFASALLASAAIFSADHKSDDEAYNPLYNGVEHAVEKFSDSFKKLFHHIKPIVAASVLWQSLHLVLSSANHDARSGFEIRVAALFADIATPNSSRRAAIVGASGGAVVDWLLESVAIVKDGGGTQAESARALVYLIADPNVSAAVLGRPHAISNLHWLRSMRS